MNPRNERRVKEYGHEEAEFYRHTIKVQVQIVAPPFATHASALTPETQHSSFRDTLKLKTLLKEKYYFFMTPPLKKNAQCRIVILLGSRQTDCRRSPSSFFPWNPIPSLNPSSVADRPLAVDILPPPPACQADFPFQPYSQLILLFQLPAPVGISWEPGSQACHRSK